MSNLLVIVINLSTFAIKLPNICILILKYTVVLKVQLTKYVPINFKIDYSFSTVNNDYNKSYSNIKLVLDHS